MIYEIEFKKINNKVYNLNKDRKEPFEYYYDSTGDRHHIGTNTVICDLSPRDKIERKIESIELEDGLIEINTMGEALALLQSLLIDLEDCCKEEQKDMKRKYID